MTHSLNTAQAALRQRRKLLKAAVGLPLTVYLPTSLAQSPAYPAPAARLVIPFQAGGATDSAARTIGSAKAPPDLIAGRTQVMIDIIVSSLPLIESCKLRARAALVRKPLRTRKIPAFCMARPQIFRAWFLQKDLPSNNDRCHALV